MTELHALAGGWMRCGCQVPASPDRGETEPGQHQDWLFLLFKGCPLILPSAGSSSSNSDHLRNHQNRIVSGRSHRREGTDLSRLTRFEGQPGISVMAPGDNHGIPSQMRLALCGCCNHQNVIYQKSADDKPGCTRSPEKLPRGSCARTEAAGLDNFKGIIPLEQDLISLVNGQ